MPLLFKAKLPGQLLEEYTHFEGGLLDDIHILFSISLLTFFNEVNSILIIVLLAF